MQKYLIRSNLKYIIFLLAVVYFAFDIKYFFLADQTQWQLFAALLFALIITGNSFSERISIVIICGMTAAMLIFFSGFLSETIYGLAVYVAIITFFTVYLGQSSPKFFLPALIINLLVILICLWPMNLIENSQRSLAVLFSLCITSILELIFLLYFQTNLRLDLLITSLRCLQQLNQEIFSCFLQADYSNNLYLYERRVHIAKMHYFRALKNLKKLPQLSKIDGLIQGYEKIYLALIDCGQLRTRVTDHTIFAICKQELELLYRVVDSGFLDLQEQINNQQHSVNIRKLNTAIIDFETITSSVLQVSAREPMAFYYFIASIRKYAIEIMELSQQII